MAKKPFGDTYATHYDLMYGQKDYQAECDLLEALFKRHSPGRVQTVLDLGCGTGNHAFPLAARGYQVTGVDQSEQMLEGARAKLVRGARPDFILSDIQRLELSRTFDVVLMMFAVMGYLADEPDLEDGLRTVRRHLAPDGLFIADFWYGPAVTAIGPSVRTLELDTPQGQLVRTATPTLDTDNHRCTVHYRLSDAEGVLLAEETHSMRYFFPDELRARLSEQRMDLLVLHPFPALEGPPDEGSWNALLCARAR